MYRTANLQSCILYIYSTNISTEYFKHGVYSPFFSLQNTVCFIILTFLVPVLFTYCIQDVLKLKKNNSGAIRLKCALGGLLSLLQVYLSVSFHKWSIIIHLSDPRHDTTISAINSVVKLQLKLGHYYKPSGSTTVNSLYGQV